MPVIAVLRAVSLIGLPPSKYYNLSFYAFGRCQGRVVFSAALPPKISTPTLDKVT